MADKSASRTKPWKAPASTVGARGSDGESRRPSADASVSTTPPVKGYADTLTTPRLTSAKEGLSSREAVSPVPGSPPLPEQTVEPVELKPGPRHNLRQKRRAGTTSARGKLAA